MRLSRLKVTNFQGIKSLELNFDGKSAAIYGDNATGKTTVFNAVTWLLFDKASTGAKSFTPKTKGPNGDVHNVEHSAEAVFETENGACVTLKKVFKEVYKKKRGSVHEEFDGHTVEYFIDSVPCKEKEYSARVVELCGGDAEKMKMLTMPDYFSEQIGWEARRSILLDICGDVPDEFVISSNPELEELNAILGTYSIEEFLKVAAAKKKDINNQLTSIPSRIDEAERAIPDIEGLDNRQTIEDAIADLQGKRNELLDEKEAIRTPGNVETDCRKRIAMLELEIVEKKTAHEAKEREQNAKLREQIDAAIKEGREAEDKVFKLRVEIERACANIKNLTVLRQKLLDEYAKEAEKRWDEKEAMCPYCKQSLPMHEVEKKRAEFNLNKSKRLEEINNRGREEANKTVIDDLNASLEKMQIQLEAAKEYAILKRSRVEQLEQECPHPVPYEHTAEYAEIMAKIAELKESINSAGELKASRIESVDEKIRAIDKAIQEKKEDILKIDLARIQFKRIGELEKQEEDLAAAFEALSKGIHLCELFIKSKVSLLTERINSKFRNVRFRLFQEQLNGGIKEDCEVMIPSAGGRMVPYAFANNAARINAGLEIINTLSYNWGIKMPVFVDNAESVTALMHTDTQTVRLVVSEADKQLRLEIGE